MLTSRHGVIVAGRPVRTFAGDVVELHSELVSAAGGGDVWLVGGGHVAEQFVSAGLVDEMIVSYAPCTLC